MNKHLFIKTIYVFMFLILLFGVTVVAAPETGKKPVAVSPGCEKEIITIGQTCPTFSWSSVDQAESYQVVIFATPDGTITSYENMAAVSVPIIIQHITGSALSWTLSVEKNLENGSMYAWYVQALDGSGNPIGSWSDGKIFKVKQETIFMGTREKLEENLKVKLPELEQNDPGSNNSTDISGILELEGAYNTLYGFTAGYTLSGTRDTLIGNAAGYVYGTTNSGDDNTMLGHQVGHHNTTGDNNTFVGTLTGQNNSQGNQNTYIGPLVGSNNTTASNNTYIGYLSGYLNTTDGTYNAFMGYGSGSNCTGDNNTIMGYYAGYYNRYTNTGSNNSFFGDFAGYTASSGNNNTYFGYQSGHDISSGSDNTFLGYRSGATARTSAYNNTFLGNSAGYLYQSGNASVFLGYNAGYNEITSNKLYIDNSTTTSPLLYGEFDNSIVTVNGKLGIGTGTPDFQMEVETDSENPAFVVTYTDGAQTFIGATESYAQFGAKSSHPFNVWAYDTWKMMINPNGSLSMYSGASCSSVGEWVDVSSRALKENIENLSFTEASTAITTMNPVKFRYKVDKKEKHVGFIAEDVPELVAAADRKGLSPMDITAVLTKVIQELEKENLENTKILSELQERVATLENK